MANNAFLNIFDKFFQGIFDLFKSFFSLIQFVVDSALSFVAGIFNFILSIFSGLINVVKDAGSFVLTNAAIILLLGVAFFGYQFYRANQSGRQAPPLKYKMFKDSPCNPPYSLRNRSSGKSK